MQNLMQQDLNVVSQIGHSNTQTSVLIMRNIYIIYEEDLCHLMAGKNNRYPRASSNNGGGSKRKDQSHFLHFHGTSWPSIETPMIISLRQSENVPFNQNLLFCL